MKCTLAFLFVAACSSLCSLAAPVDSASNPYNSKRLIQTSPTDKSWLTEDEIHALRRKGVGFRDITDIQDLIPLSSRAGTSFPTPLTHQTQVNTLLPEVNDSLAKTFLEKFTSYRTRLFNSLPGEEASNWLFEQVKEIAPDATTSQFPHKFQQSSVIARIEGSTTPDEIVIVSAHLDSINDSYPLSGIAPGADDDGSGIASTLEALRVFVSSGLNPARSIEFHWYGCEEGGLIGSADIVKAYQDKAVVADLQFDMTGFPLDPAVIGITTDYTNSEVNNLIRSIVSDYVGLTPKDFECGYGCSDHASWNETGFRSGMPFESNELEGNKNIHTENDTLDTVDFSHLTKFSQVALAFIIEVADAK